MHSAALSPSVAFKDPSLKAIRESGSFEHKLPILGGLYNKRYTFLPHDPVSVPWLCFMWASKPKFGLVTPWHQSSLGAQSVKRLPPMWKTRVQPLSQKDPLEKEMATHSSFLAWEIPWTEACGLQSMGSQRVRHNWGTNNYIHGRDPGKTE